MSNPESRKLENVSALFTKAGDEQKFVEGRIVYESELGSVWDLLFFDWVDDIKSGKVRLKHIIFSVICFLLALCFAWGDIVLMHL